MSDAKVFLNGHIDVPTDRIASVTAALPVHIALTRAEPGCLSFEVQPCPTIAGRFLVAEVFVNQAAFDAHQARTKASDWFTITVGIPRDYTIRAEAAA
ncbi:putative quinol monooxygenase [Rhizobium oryziradicis]|uniref:Antibiotic biosynthesis monooxygenase n=1 Tax=Rhizobium oryziradicis TaxID=1867956 RepID=A0A1Q8ZUI1_9HYPH|nr:antibiotic biosynthesis monooxygenase [Rhizobium oryziradicis]OLP45599.1 antibiotic biosynthesis monooxygenase [Rhizobium oryziradicis]